MAKVNLKRPWAVGGALYHPRDNPVNVPDRYATKEFLPSTAKLVGAKEDKKPAKKDEPKALSELKQEDILPTKKG